MYETPKLARIGDFRALTRAVRPGYRRDGRYIRARRHHTD
ncbi:lasso RiPP family leader peptide-containing protein [Saccharothrix obliqua]|nr:lasso RiPP family leader peptide-containing protein [Saccharothrix obliqua]MBW4718370.1 lasso RiPP family leader peptide-containing protein [Saccharothrix obliqua]